MDNSKDKCVIGFLLLFVIFRPISYEEFEQRNQFVRQEVLVLQVGGQDSTDSTFVSPNTGSRTSTSSRQKNPQPKDQTKANSGQKLTYKKPGDPGGFGAGNSNKDLPEIPDLKDTISDSEFWVNVQNQELEDSEDELNPTQMPVPSPPTYQLTKKSIKDNDFLETQLQPFVFKDWEGETKVIKSKELKKSVFSHGIEAQTSTPKDLVECPVQTYTSKYQRKDCSRITDKTAKNFSNKIVDLTTSKQPGMVKFKTKMPYYDSEIATGHMNLITGDCAFYH